MSARGPRIFLAREGERRHKAPGGAERNLGLGHEEGKSSRVRAADFAKDPSLAYASSGLR